MARPRKQTYTLKMYLEKIRDGDIDNNADVQRMMVWSKEQINELVATVLKDEYIPPIILGEEQNSQLHITDGGCRSAALNSFRNGSHKITSSVEDSVISYKRKVKGEGGAIVWEDAVFDIRNKTYDKLPDELKKKFDEYQIETVIHENCDGRKISKYIKKYNNHTSMNTDQKAFTYIDRFAGNVRRILEHRFFLDHSDYSENDKMKGVTERIVLETIMCTYHFEKWNKQPKIICKYLNENATEDEFEKLSDNLGRLEKIITDDTKDIFNKKDSFIFLTLFERFTRLGMEDRKYAEFLRTFKTDMRKAARNDKGLLFDEIKKNNSTKDKPIVAEKLAMLEKLMLEFLHIDIPGKDDQKEDQLSDEAFIAENLRIDPKELHEDMDFYNETLDILEEQTIKVGSKLRDKKNRLSLLAMVVYSYREDADLEDWLTRYASEHKEYLSSPKENFLRMKEDFERYCRRGRKGQKTGV